MIFFVKTTAIILFALSCLLHVSAQSDIARGDESRSPLSLADAVAIALEQNDDIAISRMETLKSAEDSSIARGSLLPQINANAQFTRIDRDRAKASYGGAPLETTTTGFTISQIVFNDPAITNYRVTRRSAKISDYELETAQLDTIHATATAFIDWVSKQAVLDVEKNNFDLTLRNLDLAQARREAGVAGPEEVYRWETEIAVRQSAVNSAQSAVNKARTSLNRILKKSLRTRWFPIPLDLKNDEFEFLGDRLLKLLDKKPGYDVFIDLCLETMKEKTPELKAINLAIEAQRLSVAQLKRRFFVPEVSVQFNYDYTVQENLEGDDISFGGDTAVEFNGGDDEDWSLVLRADFPLFEGGARFAELERAKVELRRLALVNGQTLDSLEEALLDAVYAIGSSHPNIVLTREAAETAEKNMAVIRDKYANGKASILDLIDAQNQAFVQRQAAVIAVYEFMLDMIDVQRAMAWFELTAPPQAVDDWLTRLEDRIEDDR